MAMLRPGCTESRYGGAGGDAGENCACAVSSFSFPFLFSFRRPGGRRGKEKREKRDRKTEMPPGKRIR